MMKLIASRLACGLQLRLMQTATTKSPFNTITHSNRFDPNDPVSQKLEAEGFKSLFTQINENQQDSSRSQSNKEEPKVAKKYDSKGRSWKAEELRLKSTEDLHKLWYICVRQKNMLLADQTTLRLVSGKKPLGRKIERVGKTMSRILGVIAEREKVKRDYRKLLEDQYIEAKRAELNKAVAKKPDPLPEITWEILRAKYKDLRKGVDNIQYLEKIWETKAEAEQKNQRAEERMKNVPPNEKFTSFWDKEVNIGERPTQEEILRRHITNWKSLNLRQRKIILGFLNARRSKDAKSAFVKELQILGKKIAFAQARGHQTKDEVEQSKQNSNSAQK